MRRITRYVLAEFLKWFIILLTGLSVVMLVFVVGFEVYKEGLAITSILKLLPYSVPIALQYTIPGTTLFVVCLIYGRMTGANEVVAIKAAGISPMKLVSPILILAFILSLVCVWLNDVAVSWGRTGTNRVILESVEQIAYGMLRTRKSYATPRFSINVRAVEGNKLIKPTIVLRLNDSGPAMTCVAEEAQLRSNPDEETLDIVLRDCEIDMGEFHTEFPGEYPQQIPLAAATRRGYDRNRPSDTALGRIPREIATQNEHLEALKRSHAAEATLQMLTGDINGLTSSDWANRHGEVRDVVSRLHRLHTEPWRRFATGFSCFCFAFLGAPLAIRWRFDDAWISFAFCFFPILIVYYPLLMYGVDLAKSGDMPPMCVWFGNAVLIGIGCYFTKKMLRY